jgi:hypothetical protein
MKAANLILEYYLSMRDFSGSAMDTYAQDLITFHVHSQHNDEEDAFQNLLEQAFNQGEYIVHVSPHAGDVLDDNYNVADLELSDGLK